MKTQDKIKQYNLMLQKYIGTRSLVKVFRTVCNEDEDLSGFILGMSKNFLFLQLYDEMTLNGYSIIKLDDFDSIRHSSYERTLRKILNAEGLLGSGYGFDKQLPLTTWPDIFNALKGYDIHVIVENINKDFLDFWIGPITRVSAKNVSIRNYNPDGVFDVKPTAIELDTISVLKFGDRYSTTFRKYLKERKK